LQKSKFAVRDRVIEFALEKKESGPFWQRLVKEKTKQHWLKIDFNKWKDEDESDEEGAGGAGGPGGAGGGQDLEAVKNLLK
jgi:prostaglandin-E synthase